MKTSKKIVSFLLCAFILFGFVPLNGFSGIAAISSPECHAVEVIPEGYTGIYDIEDLYMIRNNLSGNYILMNDIDLTDDLKDGGDWNEGTGWTTIGINATGCEPFTGVFDGNNHTLQGFRLNVKKVNSGYTGTYYCGLFGINEGTIKNLSLAAALMFVGVNVREINCGFISGSNTGTIENCNIDGTIENKITNVSLENDSSPWTFKYRFGFVSGYSDSVIDNCVVSGSLNCTGSYKTYEHYFLDEDIGNIVGCTGASSVTQNCLSTVNNTLNVNKTFGYYETTIRYGGIVGYSLGMVQNCGYSGYSQLTAEKQNIGYGGIAGYVAGGSLNNCYSCDSDTYNVVANVVADKFSLHIGGIAGYCVYSDASITSINNVYSAGKYTKDSNSVANKNTTVGGIIGYIDTDAKVSVSNAYYPNTISKGVGSGTDTCTSKSPATMTKQGAYTGFDFADIWIMYPCSGYKYPQLRSNPQDTSSDNHFCKNPIAQVDATCESDGFIRGICDGCGTEFTQILPALGHDFSEEFTVDKKADCENDGSKSKHCSRCTATADVTVISASGHDFSPWEIITESTSCEEGEMSRTCATCLKVETKSYAASEHIIVTDKAVKPTCMEDGLTEGSHCSVCHKVFVEQEVIKATGHDIVIDKPQAATCTENGLTEGSHCKTCGEIITEQKLIPAAHSFTNYVYNNDATTEKDGTETAKCDKCTATDTRTKAGTKLVHTHSYSNIVTSPTCEAKGYTTHTCSCGHSYVDSYTDALGHSFTKYIYNNDATYEADGTETAKCDRCTATDTRTKSGTKLVHTHTYSDFITSPTCEAKGYTTHTCSCGDSYVDSYTDALGHSFTKYIYNNDATYEADGTETAKCDRCTKTNTRTKTGTKLVHTHTYSDFITSPTCEAKGYTTHTCSCGHSYVDSYTDALGHSFTKYIYNNDATYEADGTETAKCDRCTATDTRTKSGTKLVPGGNNPTANAVINIASAKEFDYRTIVTIKATAAGVPEGYHLALYINGFPVKDGTNTEVSYTFGEISSDINYTVRVVDKKGNVQKNGSGNDLTKDSKITVNAGFFKKLVAFFKGLFKSLPKVEVKP